ncbi:multidrug efflux transporter AcrB transmembrane domain-containing protein [Coprinopsis marcescibilis]|uniref:Multidrug efflux transporter AcrB transmembrane domain-containing protein n=1 Tax=Coprinopsis marcescibilis TaxID=230819 RepID=A0A5C3L2K4_COPMA|nr:multidrug efflux transporter AcrB transmembrane domain-containing protein [Coprinopsis marcescibilis]
MSGPESEGQGRCAMRGHCGVNSEGRGPLPCPDDGPPTELNTRAQHLLAEVCGPEFESGPVCCSQDQVESLQSNFNRVEPIISACPACRNNFRSFFCNFTCSSQQASFVNVTSTQETITSKTAVASVDFFVTKEFSEGFYDSCKNVQMGAANSYAMTFIGGGAKNSTDFLKFLGKEQPIGSPFSINFPLSPPPEFTPLNLSPRSCSDSDISSRCACIDCPDVCPSLPPVPSPGGSTCQIGALSCLSFILILAYAFAVLGFLVGYVIEGAIRRKREKAYERVALSVESASPRTHTRGLVGAGSLSQYFDDDSLGAHSESRHLGRGASLLDPVDTMQPRHYPLNAYLRRFFFRLGTWAAVYPWLTFAIVFVVVGILNIGWQNFAIETDPVRLWVSPTSESKLQKEFFDNNFGPFYRTEQIFLTAVPGTVGTEPGNASSKAITIGEKPPVLSLDHLLRLHKVQQEIKRLESPSGYKLEDVCFKPAGAEGACVVQSVLAWFDITEHEVDWEDKLQRCADNPVDCLPDFQQPLGAQYVLGGVPTLKSGEKDYLNAEAMVVTYVVSDSTDPEVQQRAMEWEESLRSYLLHLSRSIGKFGLEIAFSTGVSLEEEINKSTNTDVKIVVLSYLAMFLYISVTLGNGAGNRGEEGFLSSLWHWAINFPLLFVPSHLRSTLTDPRNAPRWFPRIPSSLFVDSKFTLGLFGIVLVILSVSTSVGFFSFMGVKVTLIIAEVIPFLVLAVGVDNVFLLVNELDRQNLLHGPNASFSGHTDGFRSPTNSRGAFDYTQDDIDASSMPLYLPAEERVARTLAKMGPSILLSTITETTAFALGALVPMPAVRNFALYAAGSVFLNAVLQVTVFISALTLDLRRTESNRVDCIPCVRLSGRVALRDSPPTIGGLGFLAKFVRRYYAPFLLKPAVKAVVLIAFTGAFVASIISMQHIQLGLDQRLALPSDSYLVPYFDNLDAYLDIGPPVYFVATDVDPSKRPGQRSLCGRFTTCVDESLANRLEGERKRVESSFISEPTASWIDDYLRWLDPGQDSCCRVLKKDPTKMCNVRNPRLCQPCWETWNITMDGLPEDEQFMQFLGGWLEFPTTMECALGGKASFGSAVSINNDENRVVASHFRTFHKPLKNQQDFIDAFEAAHRIADEISEDIGAKVFPYSLFYVFFDQYAHIVAVTEKVLGLGLASVLLVTAILLGSWRTGSIVTAVVALTVVAVMGVMPLWGISLNAISLVNLVICLGIAVEFCAHVARAFMNAGSGLPIDHPSGQKERDERMWTALVDVGPAVLSGITFTKLIGMSVLALTRSKLLEIYYFRMWLTLIISGALHGLVLLPVVLSIAGGPGFPIQEADEEWMSNAIRNDYEPFLADDDSISSD